MDDKINFREKTKSLMALLITGILSIHNKIYFCD